MMKRALLVAAYTSKEGHKECLDHLGELSRLCDTYGLETVEKLPCSLRKPDAATYLGKGKIEELIAIVQEKEIDVVIFDDEISPHQQRNLEKLFQKAVIDRTELIIEVFAQRAQTREARLQIELAKVKYQMPRLNGCGRTCLVKQDRRRWRRGLSQGRRGKADRARPPHAEKASRSASKKSSKRSQAQQADAASAA